MWRVAQFDTGDLGHLERNVANKGQNALNPLNPRSSGECRLTRLRTAGGARAARGNEKLKALPVCLWAWAARVLAAAALPSTTVPTASALAEPSPVAMEILGHGPAVVFESGLGEGWDGWRDVAQGLTPCLTVVLYDRPGVGGSPAPHDPEEPVLADGCRRSPRPAGRSRPPRTVSLGRAFPRWTLCPGSPPTILMRSEAWYLSTGQARLNRRASLSRRCRRNREASRPPRRLALPHPSRRFWRARPCRPCPSPSLPQPTTATRLPARRFGATCNNAQRRSHRREAKTSPSILRLDDVESQKPVMLVIGNRGNAAYRLAGEFAEKESFWISGVEAFRVVQAWIPALDRSPFEGQVDLTFGHSSNNQHRGIHSLSSGFPTNRWVSRPSPSKTLRSPPSS
jgi:hypothetical protein